MNMPPPFHLLVIFRSGPYCGARVSAGIDFLLTAASFEQKVTVCFLGDGLMNLLAAKSDSPAVKNPAKAIGAFEIYGVDEIFVVDRDIDDYSVEVQSLGLPVSVVTDSIVAEVLQGADQVMIY